MICHNVAHAWVLKLTCVRNTRTWCCCHRWNAAPKDLDDGAEAGIELVIDASECANELAMVNDYRTNIDRYESSAMQECEPNAEAVQIFMPGDIFPRCVSSVD